MTNSPHLDGLKDELSLLLKEETTDFQNILRLTSEIAKEDAEVIRFSTDAAMVRRLGRELVAKQETALAELVKNAYDADANTCSVIISDDASGVMQVIDDGSGMSRVDLVNGFMRLASDEKVKNPVSPKFHRSRAGKKGIGRFATERLGRRLTVITQTEEEDQGWRVTIDWSAFEQGTDINLIPNTISAVPKERSHGTTLLIQGLNDSWTEAEVKRVYRYLSTIITPVFDSIQTQHAEDDPGFSVDLVRTGQQNVTLVNAESEIFDLAVGLIEAEIDASGKTTWSVAAKRWNLSDKDQDIGLDRDRSAPLQHARNVKLKAHYFIQARELLGHSTAYIRELLDEYGGILLYRNGYRVAPYGDREDDWLGLDYKRTSTFAPINSRTFLGFVALSDPEGELFEETSSREGLIETTAFAEVRKIMSAVLEAAVRRIEAARGKGPRARSRDTESGERVATEAESAVLEIERFVTSPAMASVFAPEERQQFKSSVARIKEAVRATSVIVRERDELLKEVNLLRILASMGLTIAEFTHDFSALAETLELSVQAIKRDATISSEALDATLGSFEEQFRRVRSYTAHFGSMMTNNASRMLEPIDLYAFARSFRNDLAAIFDRRGMQLTVERPTEYEIYTKRMHRSEWSSILLNLLTNSIKAVKRAQRAGRFLIRVGTAEQGFVFLEFSDNGDGIPPENSDRVFDAFFTTTGGTSGRSSDASQAIGTGLGLKIVADIAQSAGGRVEVVNPPEGYVTSIRITVPAGSVETDDQVETGDNDQ
jgi:signal transduction histidine kinase